MSSILLDQRFGYYCPLDLDDETICKCRFDWSNAKKFCFCACDISYLHQKSYLPQMSYLQGLDIEIDPDMFGCRQQEIGKRSIGQVVSGNRINGLELHFVTWITAIKGRRPVVDVAKMACD